MILLIDGFIKPTSPGSLLEPAATYLFPANWMTLPLSFGLLMSPWYVTLRGCLSLSGMTDMSTYIVLLLRGGHGVFPNVRCHSPLLMIMDCTPELTLDRSTETCGIHTSTAKHSRSPSPSRLVLLQILVIPWPP